jgi:hypothetical protein
MSSGRSTNRAARVARLPRCVSDGAATAFPVSHSRPLEFAVNLGQRRAVALQHCKKSLNLRPEQVHAVRDLASSVSGKAWRDLPGRGLRFRFNPEPRRSS